MLKKKQKFLGPDPAADDFEIN